MFKCSICKAITFTCSLYTSKPVCFKSSLHEHPYRAGFSAVVATSEQPWRSGPLPQRAQVSDLLCGTMAIIPWCSVLGSRKGWTHKGLRGTCIVSIPRWVTSRACLQNTDKRVIWFWELSFLTTRVSQTLIVSFYKTIYDPPNYSLL